MSVFVITVGVAVFILYRYQRYVAEGYAYAGRKAAPLRSQMLPVPAHVKAILEKYFHYYRALSPPVKETFERKVVNFMYGKRFIPRNIDRVTIEGKVLIAASAVQITLGLPDIYLQHFNKILVYPNDYYSGITRQYHKGEVNPRFGIIVLSWQSFVDGYIYPNDSINLGLHEMAHALRLENVIRNDEYNFFDEQLLAQFDEYARAICSDLEITGHAFFRAYACTNVHEFFAVAVENFFERPAAFRDALPELYHTLARLLNQDPLQLAA